MVTIRCEDRPKLLFDTVCTLTDRDYVIFRWNVDTEGPEAHHVSNFHCFRLLFILTPLMTYANTMFLGLWCRNIVSDI